MRCVLLLISPIVVLYSGLPALANDPIEGIGPTSKLVKLHDGFAFTEGPASDGRGNLYFSDIPNHRIHKVNGNGELSTFTDKSRHANGLMFNRSGELVACEMDGQVAIWNVATKTRRVLASQYDGKRFNAPNDLVIDRSGGVYFTDPKFRAPEPFPQGGQGVFYVKATGEVTRLIEDLPAPNGILLSLDGNTLYVFPSDSPEMRAYPVEAPGRIGEGRVFCRVKQSNGGLTGADGATIDVNGNIYLCTQLGLQVFSPAGEALGIIQVPQPPANATFGGPENKTLYVTARSAVYTAPMMVAGHRYASE